MEETTPLSSRNAQRHEVQRNLYRTIEHKIYTSYTLIVLGFMVSLSKQVLYLFIVSNYSTESDSYLFLWNSVTSALDAFYITLKIFRLPFVKRAREGQEIQENTVLQVGFIIQSVLYIIWQVPGNLWYWRCSDCYQEIPELTGLTLANLILGYFFLFGPALFIVSICVCLPVAIVFVMVVSGSSQTPASENLLSQLKDEKYNSQLHLGDTICTICATEYSSEDKIVVLKCDSRHYFHSECIKKWLRINSNCPICRAPYF